MELELSQLDRRYESLRRRDPARERRLVASLSGHGQQAPVVVVAGEGAAHVLVDGHKRVRALVRLRQDTVQALAWSLTELDALLLERQMRASDGDDALEQGWLLRELKDRFGLSEDELAARFDRSKSWVSRRLALVGEELPVEVQEKVRRGALGAHGAMKHLVPLARANHADCLTLLKALGERAPTSRQLGELTAAVMHGGDEPRELVLRDPWLYLRALAESQRPDGVERTPADMLLGDLGALSGIARRAEKRLREGLAEGLSPREQDEVHRCAQQAEADARALFARCGKEFDDARRIAEDGSARAAQAATVGA